MNDSIPLRSGTTHYGGDFPNYSMALDHYCNSSAGLYDAPKITSSFTDNEIVGVFFANGVDIECSNVTFKHCRFGGEIHATMYTSNIFDSCTFSNCTVTESSDTYMNCFINHSSFMIEGSVSFTDCIIREFMVADNYVNPYAYREAKFFNCQIDKLDDFFDTNNLTLDYTNSMFNEPPRDVRIDQCSGLVLRSDNYLYLDRLDVIDSKFCELNNIDSNNLQVMGSTLTINRASYNSVNCTESILMTESCYFSSACFTNTQFNMKGSNSFTNTRFTNCEIDGDIDLQVDKDLIVEDLKLGGVYHNIIGEEELVEKFLSESNVDFFEFGKNVSDIDKRRITLTSLC